MRHIFACLLVFEIGLSCLTHLFYLVILLCLTQPITVFCNIDFVFQSLNFMVWSRNGWFQLLHFIFKLAFFFHQQLIFYDFASRFSNFGPIWVFVCCNPRICADNSLAFLEVCKFVLVISSFACPYVLFLSSLLTQGGGCFCEWPTSHFKLQDRWRL